MPLAFVRLHFVPVLLDRYSVTRALLPGRGGTATLVGGRGLRCSGLLGGEQLGPLGGGSCEQDQRGLLESLACRASRVTCVPRRPDVVRILGATAQAVAEQQPSQRVFAMREAARLDQRMLGNADPGFRPAQGLGIRQYLVPTHDTRSSGSARLVAKF